MNQQRIYRLRTRSKQRGVSLVAIAITVAVLALLLVGLGRTKLNNAFSNSGQSYGTTLNTVANAVEQYRGNNLNQLTSASPTVAGFANPMAPTIAELLAAGILNAGFSPTLPDGNTIRIQILKQPAGCIGPSALCNVYSIISLGNPIVDDNGKPNIVRLGALTDSIKSPAAGSFSTGPGAATIIGGQGAWTVPNPDPGQRAGIVVVVSGLGGSGFPYLRVGDTRDPLFANSTTTGTYLKASNGVGQTVVAGTACVDPTGAIRNDVAGRLLTCQGGKWTGPDGSKVIMYRAPQAGVVGGTSFTVDTCPASTPPATAWATYTAETSATNLTVIPPYQVVTYSVSQVGGNWVTLTTATKPPAAPVTVNGNSAILGVIPTGTFSSGCALP